MLASCTHNVELRRSAPLSTRQLFACLKRCHRLASIVTTKRPAALSVYARIRESSSSQSLPHSFAISDCRFCPCLVVQDGLWDPYGDVHMGMCAELCAKEFGLSREVQDDHAVESVRRYGSLRWGLLSGACKWCF